MTEKRIVVGLNASHQAKHALAWAMNEAELHGGLVTAVHQYDYPWAPALVGLFEAPPTRAELERDALKEMEHVVSDVVAEGGWSHQPDLELRFGQNAAHTLCDEAAKADLLVVGQRGGGGFLGLRLGSVSERCLHHSTVPLAIVPEASRELEPIRRVTVGVDGSASSTAAIQYAVEQGERLGVPVVALMAWSWLGPPPREGQSHAGWDDEKARSYLQAQVRAATAADLECEIVNSRPAEALIERSAAGDLVVVAAQGTSAARSILAGSVSRQLAHHAVAPIIVVR